MVRSGRQQPGRTYRLSDYELVEDIDDHPRPSSGRGKGGKERKNQKKSKQQVRVLVDKRLDRPYETTAQGNRDALQPLRDAFGSMFDDEVLKQAFESSHSSVDAAADILLAFSLDAGPGQSQGAGTSNAGSSSGEQEGKPVQESGWGMLPEDVKDFVLHRLTMRELAIVASVSKDFLQRTREQRKRVRSFTAPSNLSLRALGGLISSLPNVETFSLGKGRSWLHEDFKVFMLAASRRHSLRTLVLKQCAVQNEDVALVTSMLPSLTSLDLTRCSLVSDDAVVALAAAVARRHRLALKGMPEVDLPVFPGSTSPAGDTFGVVGGTSSCHLKVVNIAGCSIGDAAVKALMKASIEELDVSHTRISSVAFALPTTGLALRSLRAIGCNMLQDLTLQLPADLPLLSITAAECRQLSAVRITSAKLQVLNLAQCPQLQELTLACAQLRELSVPQCTHLSHLSADCLALRRASLYNCSALPQAQFTRFVAQAAQLLSVDATGCNLLHELQLTNPELRELEVSGCRGLTHLQVSSPLTTITARNCKVLARMRVDSGSLTSLNISNCCQLAHLTLIGHRGSLLSNTAGCDALPTVVIDELAARLPVSK